MDNYLLHVIPDFCLQVAYGLARERQTTMYKMAFHMNMLEMRGLDIRVEFQKKWHLKLRSEGLIGRSEVKWGKK